MSSAPESNGRSLTADAALADEFDRVPGGPFRSALCLSGGGIRSATFALGVMQALAQLGLLTRFTYLSTVSGGGYIGGWLSAWASRPGSSFEAVSATLAGAAGAPRRPEPAQVAHLRAFSNYLSPRPGVLSADTWALVGTYLRNLLVNWMLIVPLAAAALALPRVFVALLALHPKPFEAAGIAVLGIGLGLLVVAVVAIGISLPDESGRRGAVAVRLAVETQPRFVLECLLPLMGACVLLTTWWSWLVVAEPQAAEPGVLWFAGLGLVLRFVAWTVYSVLARGDRAQSARGPRKWPFVLAGLAGSGAAGGALVWLAAVKLLPQLLLDRCDLGTPAVFTSLATPVLVAALLLTETLYIALASRRTSGEDLEWYARAGGWLLAAGLGWLVVTFVTFFGPTLMAWGAASSGKLVAALGGVSGIVGAAAGYSARTAGTRDADRSSASSRWLNRTAVAAGWTFVACLVSALSAGLSWIGAALEAWHWIPAPVGANTLTPCSAPAAGGTFRFVAWVVPDAGGHITELVTVGPVSPLIVAAALAVLVALVAGLVNINVFSLHAVYRARLIRAYLGASNPARPAEGRGKRFIDFRESDDVRMADLKRPPGPFHVVNTALNLVHGDNLAWQERKAESFTFTPLHAGSEGTGYRPLVDGQGRAFGGGVTLGTAMTISGAAANPNMGYHSAPIVTLVMTLFNARLGAWVGNPRSAWAWRRRGPLFGVAPLVSEAFGLTTDTSSFVNLSDGGHFDNLGLYEMVRRRCRFILVSDAGCDPGFTYEDLGRAVSRIRVDFGIPIEFPPGWGTARTPGRLAVARIRYARPEATAEEADRVDGVLVYLKPVLTGGEPKDVAAYAAAHRLFPHEPTSDQWFSESQFESYRALGHHTVMEELGAARPATLEELAAAACDAARVPSVAGILQ